jgi:6-phosphofructokinase
VALYTAIASGADAVCLPERKPDMAAVAARVKKAHARKGFALVVASEAVELPSDGGEQKLDEFGHTLLKDRGVGETLAKLLEKDTGIEARHAVIGHVQRGGPPTLFDRILGTRVGVKAAELVQKKRFGQMVALRGNEVVAVPLEEAVAKLKTVSEDWLQLADSLMA